MGIIGFILYLLFWRLVLKELKHKLDIENICLLLFGFLSNIFLNPIIAYPYSLIILKKLKNTNDTSEKYSYKKTTIFLVIIIIISTFIGYIIYSKNTKEIINDKNIININMKIDNGIKLNKDYKLKILDKKITQDMNVEETLYYYEIKRSTRTLAEIIYAERKIDDVIIEYITLNNKGKELDINLEISNQELKEIDNFEKYNIDFEFNHMVGKKKLKLPIGYYSSKNNNMIVGRSIEYTTLISNYENGNKSKVYNLIDQKNDLNKNKKIIKIKPNTSVDTYIIKSKKNLFENEKSIKNFANTINNNSSWIRYNGNIYKIQYSIEPFTREGYSKLLGRLIEEELFEKRNSKESILYNVLHKSAIFSLYYYTPRTSDNGVWLTEYTSTWLSNDYGTKAYYVDTRYNETIGYHLLEIYNVDKTEKYKDSFLEYANFIVKEWNGNNTYKVLNSKLLADYFSDTNISNTHSSLNHQLALVNYLFKAYEISKNLDYLNTAEDLLNNLLILDEKWILENGDLWYQVNEKGEFSGTDYEIVTLDDLVITQDYLLKIKGEKNKIIDKFIISKANYLKNKGTNIPAFTLEMISKLNIKI